jgi:hypothetical protein
MNDISETQRVTDAIAALALILSDKMRAAGQKGQTQSAELNAGDGYPNRYAPIPPNGKRCEFTGLGHAKLYTVLAAGGPARKKVRVANLRTPGASRGQTLFHVGDMLRFLDDLAAEQVGETDDGAPRRSH